MEIIRVFFIRPDIYTVRVDAADKIENINWQNAGKEVSYDHPFANYRERDGRFSYLYQPLLGSLNEDLMWFKSNPRPAHWEVFPRGEIIDEGNGDKVVKVLKNVTLLDMLDALKEFMTQR